MVPKPHYMVYSLYGNCLIGIYKPIPWWYFPLAEPLKKHAGQSDPLEYTSVQGSNGTTPGTTGILAKKKLCLNNQQVLLLQLSKAYNAYNSIYIYVYIYIYNVNPYVYMIMWRVRAKAYENNHGEGSATNMKTDLHVQVVRRLRWAKFMPWHPSAMVR